MHVCFSCNPVLRVIDVYNSIGPGVEGGKLVKILLDNIKINYKIKIPFLGLHSCLDNLSGTNFSAMFENKGYFLP